MSTFTGHRDSTDGQHPDRTAPSHSPRAHPLRAHVAGPVLLPGDEGFAQEVAGFNLALTHSPDVVVGATSAADVVAAVSYAAEHDLPVGVQATGHGIVSLVDSGVLVSTVRMQDVVVDPIERTVTVGAGVKWRAVLDAAEPHGLTGPCGSTSDVGVVGYTLGGGLPVLGRAVGFASDHVRSMDVVTADGTLHHVDPEHDVDLFWALRGGQGNVGIVTSMTLDLLPIRQIHAGGLFFDGQLAAPVLRAFRDLTREVPEETCLSLAFLRLPPVPDVPEPLRGRFVVHVRVAHVGDGTEVEHVLSTLRSAAPVMTEMVGPLPTSQLDRVHNDPEHPVPVYERGALLHDLDDATVDGLLAVAGPDSGTPALLVEVRQLGGALGRPGRWPDAVGAREATFSLYAVGVMAPPLAAVMPQAIEGLVEAMAPHCSERSFVNLFGTVRDDADRARCWSAETYARLQATKAAHDPMNRFRFGHAVALPA
ncbi:MAG TPA: FAD-binding oxidoreductase [Actinomycetales bacterium]|nr:FAD-binding oxidoreductase [Actinomycetales bacterium]